MEWRDCVGRPTLPAEGEVADTMPALWTNLNWNHDRWGSSDPRARNCVGRGVDCTCGNCKYGCKPPSLRTENGYCAEWLTFREEDRTSNTGTGLQNVWTQGIMPLGVVALRIHPHTGYKIGCTLTSAHMERSCRAGWWIHRGNAETSPVTTVKWNPGINMSVRFAEGSPRSAA